MLQNENNWANFEMQKPKAEVVEDAVSTEKCSTCRVFHCDLIAKENSTEDILIKKTTHILFLIY